MPLDVEELEPTTRNDYRRANGAPMVLVNGRNERYSRPSSFAKPLDDESALVSWKIDRGCFGVAGDRALQARWCALDLDDKESGDEKRKLREDSINAGRGAEKADIGTALHKMSVRFEQDLSFSPPQPYLESLQAYLNEMTRLNLSTVRTEFHTVNIEYRCAGTADRLYELGSPLVTPTGEILPVGTLVIADLKTGEKLEYSKPAYAVQTYLYAAGQFYDVLSDEFVATPAINQQWGIVVHMPAEFPGTCEFLWVDLEVGAHGAYIVQMVKTWRKMWRSGEFDMPLVQLDTNLAVAFDHRNGLAKPVATVATILDEPAAGPTAIEPSGRLTSSAVGPFDNGEELAAHIEWARERLAQVAGHTLARQALILRWPTGLPTPKQGIETLEQARDVHCLLDMIEADYELSFVPRPAAILGTGQSTRKRKGK